MIDGYLPDHLLSMVSLRVDAVQDPYPPLDYHPVLVSQGAFVAWWDAGRPVEEEEVELRPMCTIGDSRLPEEGVPEARGVVEQLYWALDLLRRRADGPWDSLPGVGLIEVESTDITPEGNFTAYFPETDVDPASGLWRHVGWFALLRCE